MISNKIIIADKKKTDLPVIDSNVVFLCHFDQSPPINVPTSDAATIINMGYYSTNMVLTSPEFAKFGQGYLQHGGTVGGGQSEYITFPKRFNFGTRDFTIESWHVWSAVFSPTGASQYGWELGLDASYYCGLELTGSRYNGGMILNVNRGYNSVSAFSINITGLSSVLPADKYFHIAVVREGSVLRVFLNGKKAGEQVIGSLSITDGNLLKFGVSNNAYQPGCRLDETRIVMDQALYSADFVPPTAPYPNPVAP